MTRKIMRVSDPVRVTIPEIGRFYKGSPSGTSKKPGNYQGGDDYSSHYFRFEPSDRFKSEPATTDEFRTLYDELKDRWESIIAKGSVSVRLPYATVDENCGWENAVDVKWGTGSKRIVKCDGQTCTLWNETYNEGGKKKYKFHREPRPCAAIGDDRECPLGCSPKSHLRLYVPELYPGGMVVFPMGSPIDIQTIRGNLAVFGDRDLRGIPLSLLRKPQRVNFTDYKGAEQSRENWQLTIQIDPSVVKAMLQKQERRFKQYLNSDDEFIEAEVTESRQQRSIAPSATPKSPNFKTSDDGFNFLQQLQAAMNGGSLELMAEALEIARDLVSSGYYDRSGLAWIDSEEDRARSAIRALQPAIVPIATPQKQKTAPISPASTQINYFKKMTESTTADIKAICDRLDLPKSSAEMSEDQAIVLVGELLIEWAVESKWIDREIAVVMVGKSIEATNTDEDLWNDFTLRIEAFKAETGEAK